MKAIYCLCLVVFPALMTNAQTFPCNDISFDGSAVCKSKCYTVTTRTFGTVYSSFDFPVPGSTTINLQMDIYSPPKSTKLRPFILILHAGGFRIGCRSSASKLCKEFANRGFVAATIDYRLGWVPKLSGNRCSEGTDYGDDNNNPNDDACASIVTCRACGYATRKDQVKATYRAVQDALAALRYIVHFINNRNSSGVLNEFNIDPGNIFVGGQSAGAAASLGVAYMQQEDWNADSPDYQNELGGINSSGNPYTDTFKIKGVFANWGGILDIKYIQDRQQDRIPYVAFHGQCDNVFPYLCGTYSGCKTLVSTYGAKSIYNKLSSFPSPVSVALYSEQVGGHGILECTDGTIQRVACAVNFFRSLSSSSFNPIKALNEALANTCKEKSCSFTSNCSNNSLQQSSSSNLVSSTIPIRNELKGIKVYPNPARGTISYSYTTTKSSPVEIQIVNSLSQIVYNNKATKQAGMHNEKLPVKLNPGIYIVTIKIDQSISVTKVISE